MHSIQLTQKGIRHDSEDGGDGDDADLEAVDDFGHGGHAARRDHVRLGLGAEAEAGHDPEVLPEIGISESILYEFIKNFSCLKFESCRTA